jgi:hypothetical protein
VLAGICGRAQSHSSPQSVPLVVGNTALRRIDTRAPARRRTGGSVVPQVRRSRRMSGGAVIQSVVPCPHPYPFRTVRDLGRVLARCSWPSGIPERPHSSQVLRLATRWNHPDTLRSSSTGLRGKRCRPSRAAKLAQANSHEAPAARPGRDWRSVGSRVDSPLMHRAQGQHESPLISRQPRGMPR